MLNTVYTDANFNKIIASRCANTNPEGNKVPATKKQITWLKTAMKDYAITIANVDELSKFQASMKITAISIGIANGSIKPRAVVAVKKVYYAVMLIDGVVSIKSFLGDKKTAFDKMVEMYNKDNCRYFTEDVNIAKASAKALHESLHSTNAGLLASLKELEVADLLVLAKEYSIKLGKATKKETIIKKFEEQLAS